MITSSGCRLAGKVKIALTLLESHWIEWQDPRGIQWRLAAEARDLIESFVAPALRPAAEGAAAPTAARRFTLKQSQRRQVFALAAPGRVPVAVKCYPPRRSLALRLRESCKPRAVTEAQMASWLWHRGLPTPRPLAVGVGHREDGVASYYVAEMLLATTALGPALESHFRPGDRSPAKARLVRQARRILQDLHDAGVYHRDYHGGNLLWREAEGPLGRLWLIDLARARRLGDVAAGLRVRDHADLVFSLRHALDRAEIQEWVDGIAEFELDPADLARALRRKARVHDRSRAARAFVKSGSFRVDRSPGVEVHRRREWSLDVVIELQQQHDAAVRAGGESVWRMGRRSRLSVQQTGDGRQAMVKEFRSSRSAPAGSRARRSYAGGVALTVRDIPAAETLALIQRREPQASYVVLEALADRVPLHLLTYRMDGSDTHVRAVRKLADAISDLLIGMIEREVYHPDLSPKNLLVDEDLHGAAPVCLVDFDPVQPGTTWTAGRLARALAQLGDLPSFACSRSTRLRFVRQVLRAIGREESLGSLLRESARLLRKRRKLGSAR